MIIEQQDPQKEHPTCHAYYQSKQASNYYCSLISTTITIIT